MCDVCLYVMCVCYMYLVCVCVIFCDVCMYDVCVWYICDVGVCVQALLCHRTHVKVKGPCVSSRDGTQLVKLVWQTPDLLSQRIGSCFS